MTVQQLEAVFVPADPPRAGRLALWGAADGHERVEVVTAAGRRKVPARMLSVAESLDLLTGSADAMGSASLRAWSAAALAGLGLISRGRLTPARTGSGYAAWRVGPLDPDDHAWLRELAEAMPPEAHALGLAGTRPTRLHDPQHLVRSYWDAIADVLVRTPAAAVVGGEAFASDEPFVLAGPTEWLAAAEQAENAARLVLRIEPPEEDEDAFRAVFQLRSGTDPSLLVDVAELWQQPAAVLQALGQQAETDLLLALRRGGRVWQPLERALQASAPVDLPVVDEELEQLITDGGTLEDAGIEVLWPAQLFGGDLKLRATATPSPGAVTSPDFSLTDMLSFSWQPTLDGEVLTDAEIAALAEAKRPVVRMRGRWIRVDQSLVAKLRRRQRRRLSAVEALAAALTGELEVDGELVDFRTDDRLADLADRLRLGTEAAELPPPPGLDATLRDYQRRGVAWMNHLADIGLGGCLADDMGLGKTIQVIALHLHRAGRTLVVCPSSLLGTWERELTRFAPEVPKRRYHGAGRSLEELAPDEVVLTTYGVVRQDHRLLAATEFDLAVADEAQHAKNPLSRTAHALRNLNAGTRLALTGTPVENRLSELWSILDWATPGLLGPLPKFRHEVAVPVERYRDPDATERLAKVTRPFLLRRRKSDPGIAPELPPKTEHDVVAPLTTEQGTLYQAVVSETLDKIQNSEGIVRQGLVLGLLTQLKQICNHPAQFLKQPGPLPRRSGKLAALDELLDVIVDAGESVLVFSQYVEMCRLIESHLGSRGVPTRLLHGGVDVRKRERMVEEFQSGAVPVFLLSLKAGGVGLTLTRASHVVHYDRWWNPAVEDQATDRAYRIGQDKPVQVHKLITEGTLEDRIAAVIESKRDLAASVIGSGEAWIGDLSDAELEDLVQLGGQR